MDGVCLCGVCGEGGVHVWVGGCDCVGVGVIAWVRKGVCGWDSLDCCLKVCTCVCQGRGGRGGGRSACVCVGVGVTVWVWV